MDAAIKDILDKLRKNAELLQSEAIAAEESHPSARASSVRASSARASAVQGEAGLLGLQRWKRRATSRALTTTSQAEATTTTGASPGDDPTTFGSIRSELSGNV